MLVITIDSEGRAHFENGFQLDIFGDLSSGEHAFDQNGCELCQVLSMVERSLIEAPNMSDVTLHDSPSVKS